MKLVSPVVASGLLLLGCQEPKMAPVRTQLTPVQAQLMASCRDQLTWGTRYDGSYVKLDYPGGDVDLKKGVCTDVVIRALRRVERDLQKLVHEDIMQNRRAYPAVNRPDKNIDHRRVPNQIIFFRRHGRTLSLDLSVKTDWRPGDVVYWKLPNGRDHAGVLSDRKNSQGLPLVFHNIGPAPSEEDVLAAPGWKIIGHFRYPR